MSEYQANECRRELAAIKRIYREFDRVYDPEVVLPELAETVFQDYRELIERVESLKDQKGVRKPTYTIKPPVWEGNFLKCAGHYTAVCRVGSGDYYGILGNWSTPFPTEAEAREWCEQRYYEWVKQFLEEVKT